MLDDRVNRGGCVRGVGVVDTVKDGDNFTFLKVAEASVENRHLFPFPRASLRLALEGGDELGCLVLGRYVK